MGFGSPSEQLVCFGEVELLPCLVTGDEECVESARPASHEVDSGKVGRRQVALVSDPQVYRVLHGDFSDRNPPCAVARAGDPEGGDGHPELAAEVAANALTKAFGEAIDPGVVEGHLRLASVPVAIARMNGKGAGVRRIRRPFCGRFGAADAGRGCLPGNFG